MLFRKCIYRNIVRVYGLEEKTMQTRLRPGWRQIASQCSTNEQLYMCMYVSKGHNGFYPFSNVCKAFCRMQGDKDKNIMYISYQLNCKVLIISGKSRQQIANQSVGGIEEES